LLDGRFQFLVAGPMGRDVVKPYPLIMDVPVFVAFSGMGGLEELRWGGQPPQAAVR